MLAFLNRCAFVPTAYSNTDDFAVNGSAPVTGFYAPADCLSPAVVDTATYNYFAQSADKTQHEEGRAVWDDGAGKLLRAAGTVRNSSNSGALVNFSAAPTVTMGSPAAADMMRAGNLVLNAGFAGLTGSIDISGDPVVRFVNLSNNQLASVDAAGCTSLKVLNCNNSSMTSLDFTGCVALTNVDCSNNLLPSLDVSGCAAIVQLNCSSNQLTSLDATPCVALQGLDVTGNLLTALNISSLVSLVEVDCNSNALTNLDVSTNVALNFLFLQGNALTELAVDAILASFDSNGLSAGEVDLSGGTNAPPSAAGLTSKSNLEGKGWNVFVN